MWLEDEVSWSYPCVQKLWLLIVTGRTVLEVLQDFKSAQVPLEWLLQTVPHLKPRQFSIASSPTKHPHSAHILVAVVDYKTPFKRRKQGLCSAWLASLQAVKPNTSINSTHSSSNQISHLPDGIRSSDAAPSQHNDSLTNGLAAAADSEAVTWQDHAEEQWAVPVWVERGVLHLPASHSVPMVLIGPGTGVAPFRSFLEERQMAAAGKLYILICPMSWSGYTFSFCLWAAPCVTES